MDESTHVTQRRARIEAPERRDHADRDVGVLSEDGEHPAPLFKPCRLRVEEAERLLERRGHRSVDALELVLGLETEFGVRVQNEELARDSFASVAALAALVLRLASQPQDETEPSV